MTTNYDPAAPVPTTHPESTNQMISNRPGVALTYPFDLAGDVTTEEDQYHDEDQADDTDSRRPGLDGDELADPGAED